MIFSIFHRSALLARALIRTHNLIILLGRVRLLRAVIIALVFEHVLGNQGFTRSDNLTTFCVCKFGVGLFIRWRVVKSARRFSRRFRHSQVWSGVGAFPSCRFIILASAG